ncbi:MAG: M23 family metallopeptidase [Patescibacteria group bacterium]
MFGNTKLSNKIKILFTYKYIFISVFFLLPSYVFASYYTLPIDDITDPDISTTSWFDHDSVLGQMTRFTGLIYQGLGASLSSCGSYNNGFGCYDNHHGIDYGTRIEGKNIYAADSGVIHRAGWENPNHTVGYGFHMAILHPIQNQCSVYAHLKANSNYFAINSPVLRGDKIDLLVLLYLEIRGVALVDHTCILVFGNFRLADKILIHMGGLLYQMLQYRLILGHII